MLKLWVAALLMLLPIYAPAFEHRLAGHHAYYDGPTDRYAHGVLGDKIEWGILRYTRDTPALFLQYSLPPSRVFEDVAPRLIDLNADGLPEIVVVESDMNLGAQLAIYGVVQGRLQKITATPHIGKRFRWLAPIGAADFDGDGAIEIAYIDRPHLAKTLRIWRFENNKLTHLADRVGLTNHKIGQDYITGGVRDCSGITEMITVDANWGHIIATTFDGTQLHSRQIAPYTGLASVAAVLEGDCM